MAAGAAAREGETLLFVPAATEGGDLGDDMTLRGVCRRGIVRDLGRGRGVGGVRVRRVSQSKGNSIEGDCQAERVLTWCSSAIACKRDEALCV